MDAEGHFNLTQLLAQLLSALFYQSVYRSVYLLGGNPDGIGGVKLVGINFGAGGGDATFPVPSVAWGAPPVVGLVTKPPGTEPGGEPPGTLAGVLVVPVIGAAFAA